MWSYNYGFHGEGHISKLLGRALELAEEIYDFPLHECGPSDDPDKQYAYSRAFLDKAVQFSGLVRQLGDSDLIDLLPDLDHSADYISDAHDSKAQLVVLIDSLREKSKTSDYFEGLGVNTPFVDESVISKIASISSKEFDLSKLIQMLKELNAAYVRNNLITSILLIRAIMNHVPPIFGFKTFSQYASQSGRSVKVLLLRLEEEARPISDFHNHMTIRKIESVPTKNQVEPYKPSFEILLNEIINEMNKDTNREEV